MKPKYLATLNYHFQCPTCNSPSYDRIQFFYSLKDVLEFALENMGRYQINEVYSTGGKELFTIREEFGRHSVTGLTVNIRDLKLRTADNGHGKKVWVKYE